MVSEVLVETSFLKQTGYEPRTIKFEHSCLLQGCCDSCMCVLIWKLFAVVFPSNKQE